MSQRTPARHQKIIPISEFSATEKTVMTTSCPSLLAQFIVRDRRIKELEKQIEELQRKMNMFQLELPLQISTEAQ